MTRKSIIDAQPEVRAVDKKRADWADRKAKFDRRAGEIRAKTEQQHREYQAAVDAALLDGKTLPKRPDPLVPPDALPNMAHRFMIESQEIDQERRRTVASVYGRIVDQATDEAAALVTEIRPVLDRLLQSERDARSILSEVQTARQALQATRNDDTGGQTGIRDHRDARFNLPEWMGVIGAGKDLLTAMLDLPERPDDQDDPPTPDGLGMSNEGRTSLHQPNLHPPEPPRPKPAPAMSPRDLI